jgi:hypothetical protein
MKKFSMAVALFAATFAVPALAETLDNAKVVKLVNLGIGNEAVIAKIKASDGDYDVSTDALIALKNANVPGPVIAAMIDVSSRKAERRSTELSMDSPDPKVPHGSGVYMLASWLPQPKMVAINPTTSSQTKTGGFLGYALTGGIASMSFKAVVPGAGARTQSDVNQPTFYFYFDQSRNGGNSAIWNAGTVTSPNEFSLVRFDVKKDKREAKVGKFNIGGAKAGVMDKDRIPFTTTEISPGVFEVRPDQPLAGGQYGFLVQTSTGGGPGMSGMGAMAAKIFDFSIPVPPATKK